MTRTDLLKIVIGRARANGFEFRRWYTARLGVPWISAEAAIVLLEAQRRYYALLFSHEFANAFWKAGEEITFEVPSQTFQRVKPDGSIVSVQRKSFIRRSGRRDAWRYHLREMALSEEPLRYIRKYLNVEEELSEEPDSNTTAPKPTARRRKKAADLDYLPALPAAKPSVALGRRSREKPMARPMPTGLPHFLKRPYP
jgi:hypothetical protein